MTAEEGATHSSSSETKLGMRYGLIGLLILLMLIPLLFVSGVSNERKSYYQSTLADIAKGWGGQQSIVAPVLVIPVLREVVIATGQKQPRVRRERQQLIVLPEDLTVQVHLQHQFRHRGIYTIPVYSAKIEVSGSFAASVERAELNQKDEILWQDVFVAASLSDVRGIAAISPLSWSDNSAEFRPGTNLSNSLTHGVHARLSDYHGEPARFAFSMTLKGTERLSIMPLGSTSKITVDGSWPSPSFSGAYLPDHYQIDNTGFTSQWEIQAMARGLPDAWFEHAGVPQQQNFVNIGLHDPVTVYTLVDRGIKYALLFITLTFLAFVCFEFIAHTRFHTIQYGVVGLALVLFYLTLLSLSEHMAFGLAYAVATLIMAALISWYVGAITHSRKLVVIIATVELVLYLVLYVLLQLEAYALAAGTAVLLFGLFALMYATRGLAEGAE